MFFAQIYPDTERVLVYNLGGNVLSIPTLFSQLNFSAMNETDLQSQHGDTTRESEFKFEILHARQIVLRNLPEETRYIRIVQQYLQIEPPLGRRVRCLVKDNGVVKFKHQIKAPDDEDTDTELLHRNEDSEDINQAVFQRLRDEERHPDAELIIKNRMVFPAAVSIDGERPDIEIDYFRRPIMSGTQKLIGEIEIDNELPEDTSLPDLLPDWMDLWRDRTHDKRYGNFNIACGSLP